MDIIKKAIIAGPMTRSWLGDSYETAVDAGFTWHRSTDDCIVRAAGTRGAKDRVRRLGCHPAEADGTVQGVSVPPLPAETEPGPRHSRRAQTRRGPGKGPGRVQEARHRSGVLQDG